MNYTLRTIVAILIPFAALGAWLYQMEKIVITGTELEFPVTGYDPRDLLAGHYLTYRINYGETKICEGDAGTVKCVCLSALSPSGYSSATSVNNCEAVGAGDCTLFIRGTCGSFDRFEAGIERINFPENLANRLFAIPEGATVKVRVDENGNAVATNMFINGMSLGEFALSGPVKPTPLTAAVVAADPYETPIPTP